MSKAKALIKNARAGDTAYCYRCCALADELESASAENKRLEALDKDWLRASEQWAAENSRLKNTLAELKSALGLAEYVEGHDGPDDFFGAVSTEQKEIPHDRGSNQYANPDEIDGDIPAQSERIEKGLAPND